jgi:chorismate dehydratase
VTKTKISVVQYLNSVPLAWGILEGPQKDQFDAVFSTPAECAAQLASGEVDLGLIPSIEYQRIPGTRIVAGPAVASHSRALSVILLSLVPLFRVRSVAHDSASRASVALTQVVLNEFYGNKPEFCSRAPDPVSMLADNDAALLIGDSALQYRFENQLPNAENEAGILRDGAEPVQTFDLMERWNNLTGLPFVFAFWAARKGFNDATVAEGLTGSRAFGLENIDTIAERYQEKLGIDKAFLLEYLQKNMDYHMDSDGVAALGQFYQMAARAGILKSVRGIDFL